MARRDLGARYTVSRLERGSVSWFGAQLLDQLRLVAEAVLDLVEQRVQRLIFEPGTPAVPEQAALPPDVEDAGCIAGSLVARETGRAYEAVRVRVIWLVAGRTRHPAVRAEDWIEEQRAPERNPASGA